MKLFLLFSIFLLIGCESDKNLDNCNFEPSNNNHTKEINPKIIGKWSLASYRYYPNGHTHLIDYSRDTLLIETLNFEQGKILQLEFNEKGKLTINNANGEFWNEGMKLILNCRCIELNVPFACHGEYLVTFLNEHRMTLQQSLYDEAENEIGAFSYSLRRLPA